MITKMAWCLIGFIMVVAGGFLGYYVHALLYTLMPLGAVLCAGFCWRLSRV